MGKLSMDGNTFSTHTTCCFANGNRTTSLAKVDHSLPQKASSNGVRDKYVHSPPVFDLHLAEKRPALADDVGRLDDDMAHVRLQIRPAQSRVNHFHISSPIPFPFIPSRPPSRPLTHSIHPLCPPEQASSTRSRVRSGPSVPLSSSPDRSRHSRASDLIRHGKNHHSARQQDDAAYQSTYAQSQM